MSFAMLSSRQGVVLLLRQGGLARTALISVPVRGMKVKEFKEENPNNPMKPWPYETKDYKWYHSFFNLDRTMNRMDENSKVILVEGNIGAGKSTLAKNLAEMLGMKYYPEACFEDYSIMLNGYSAREHHDKLGPTAQDFDIADFYKDPFHPMVARFQVTKYMARHFQYCEALLHLFSTGQGVIMERSPYSDFVFADAMAKQGYMGRLARRYYYELKSSTIQELMRPHCIIYLDAPVDVCLERIKNRNIDYEVQSEVLTPEYLKLLEAGYKEKFLKQMEPFTETIVYDWSTFADAEAIAEDLEKVEFDKKRYYYDPMFRDWGEFYIPADWDQPRTKFTKWKDWATFAFMIPESYGADELWVTPDDNETMDIVRNEVERKASKYYVRPDAGIWEKFKTLVF